MSSERPTLLNTNATGAPSSWETVKSVGGAVADFVGGSFGRLVAAGLPPGGESSRNMRATANWTRSGENDFRVKIVLPSKSELWLPFFGGSPEAIAPSGGDFDKTYTSSSSNKILRPLAGLGGVVFPITPGIIITHTASYSAMNMPHSNYPHYAYNHSEVPSFTITAEFPVQNSEDAKYWVAMLHFFRSVTKMFFGGDDAFRGNPPPILQFSGYGDYVFKNIPVVVTAFSIDMRNDVDYICTEQNFVRGEINRQTVIDPGVNKTWAPTLSTMSIQLQPIYSRDSVKKFSMQKFVNGGLLGNDSGGVGFI